MTQDNNENYEKQLAEFKELQAQSKAVSEQAIRLNTQIENAQENYKKLIEASDKKFGTHNIEELKELLKNWSEDNANRLQAWKERISGKTNEVENKKNSVKIIQQN